MSIALALGHVLAGAIWLGAMVYSLLVVQPRAAAFFAADDEAHEGFLTALAGGNRWPVLGLVALIAGTGLVLAAMDPPAGLRLAIQLGKGAALLVATGVFVHVSWWLWPRRLFALPTERPKHRAALRRAAYVLVTAVGVAFTLGLVGARLA